MPRERRAGACSEGPMTPSATEALASGGTTTVLFHPGSAATGAQRPPDSFSVESNISAILAQHTATSRSP